MAKIAGIICVLHLNEFGIRLQCEAEIARLRSLSAVLGKEGTADLDPGKVDPKTYAQHILKNGSASEKRILLSNLRSMLIYKNTTLEVIPQ